jgi:hypothetical protein
MDSTGDACDDGDGDGYFDETEFHVGTQPILKCGNDGWPADLFSTGLSENKVNVQDITSFLAPVRRLGTSPSDADYSVRWDLIPGRGVFPKDINIQDLTHRHGRPPMLNARPPWVVPAPAR